MRSQLGYEPVIKAEPYTAGTPGHYKDILSAGTAAKHTNLLIAAVIISAFLVILVLVALLFLLHRAKMNGGGLLNKHRKLGSPISTIDGSSKNASQHGLQSSIGGSAVSFY